MVRITRNATPPETPRPLAALGRASVAVVLALALAGCSPPAVSGAGPGTAAGGERPAPTSPAPQDRVLFAAGAPAVAADSAEAPFDSSADADWVAGVASATIIPERALRAYAAAALRSAEEDPDCGMSWNLLAGIGQVESRHGFIDGSRLDAEGRAEPAIIGIPLDGVDTASIPDSDGGDLDADPDVDRAVGPLQLIPQSWRAWGVDADGDGIADPQDIDDASLTAAHYLCDIGDLAAPDSWREAVLSWNRSEEYLADVSSWAAFYAEAAAR
jgi:membrane-bound lytic murein transglycosylase B